MGLRTAIDVSGLSRSFTVGRRRRRRVVEAVRTISFSVDPGERLAFIGPNGAGKSTSIKMLTGILHPTAGSAVVLGLVPWQDRRELTRRIGTLFGQRSQLWQELSPLSSLRLLGAIHAMSDAAIERRVATLGDLFEARELFEQPVRTLSLGQRMRCELAACMLHQPELLFLDEPTIGLDLTGKQRFRELLVRLNDELGTTVFLTSHDVADIEHVADRAIVVNHGAIIFDAPVADMRGLLLSSKRVDVGLAGAVDSAAVERELAARYGSALATSFVSSTLLRLDVDTAHLAIREVLDHLLATLPVVDLSVLDPPLEQVIGEIYERPR